MQLIIRDKTRQDKTTLLNFAQYINDRPGTAGTKS